MPTGRDQLESCARRAHDQMDSSPGRTWCRLFQEHLEGELAL